MKTYTVVPGDTLYGISKQFGVSIQEIVELNDLGTDNIYVGQILKIPSTEEEYIVQDGDSLYSIARKYGISVNDLLIYNNLTSPNLYVGQMLIIPLNNEKKYIDYTVKDGDSLYSLAQEYNVPIDEIKLINDLTTNVIFVGQKLKIPVIQEKTVTAQGSDNVYKTYIVKKGDNLYSIAEENNMTVDEIKRINNLKTNLLSIGQELKIVDNKNDENAPVPYVKECYGTDYKEPEYETYTVQNGDNLYSIAQKFNTTVDYLTKINNLQTNELQVGQVLKIKEI